MPFKRVYSKAPWETEVGYCRAIRAGNHVYVTGTAPVAEGGGVFAPGDAYAQAKRCLEIIEKVRRLIHPDMLIEIEADATTL